MDNLKLAELLYPNCKYTVEELESIYPKRNLPEGAEVTRFAPSPTGYLHIGNFFSAMVSNLLALTTNGIFYFRLEDTDKKREISGADMVALEILNRFGIRVDEGLMTDGKEIGKYGPYRQSKRIEIYKTFARKLVSEGKAFPCFCEKPKDKECIFKKRENELKDTNNIEEKDPCRNLSYKEIEDKIYKKIKFALRLKSSGKEGDKITVFDICRGESEIPANSKDIVLVKDNGIPPYAFAHAVDDHLMRTTTVVRGSDWLSTWSQHYEVFKALDFKLVNYVHIPLISKIGDNGNKRKISKRYDPEADMRFYLEKGIPTIAVNEYLLNLINSDFEIWRANNPNLSYKEFPFSISKMGSNNPMFDLVKLSDISKTIISKMTAEEVYENLFTWAKDFDAEFASYLDSNKEYAIKVLSIDRYTPKPRKDIAKWSDVKEYFSYMFEPYFNLNKIEDYEILESKEIDKKLIKNINEVVGHYKTIYDDYEEKQEWFDNIKNMSAYLGFAVDNKDYKANPEKYKGNVADVCTYIRLALTGRKNSPDIYEISKILGKERVLERLEKLYNLTK